MILMLPFRQLKEGSRLSLDGLLSPPKRCFDFSCSATPPRFRAYSSLRLPLTRECQRAERPALSCAGRMPRRHFSIFFFDFFASMLSEVRSSLEAQPPRRYYACSPTGFAYSSLFSPLPLHVT